LKHTPHIFHGNQIPSPQYSYNNCTHSCGFSLDSVGFPQSLSPCRSLLRKVVSYPNISSFPLSFCYECPLHGVQPLIFVIRKYTICPLLDTADRNAAAKQLMVRCVLLVYSCHPVPIFRSGTDLISLLILFWLGRPLQKTSRALSFQIGSG